MKINKTNNKKGDISAATLVSVILLVIGFGIVMIFVFRMYYSGNIDKEICRESVTLRAIASRAAPGALQKTAESFVELVCKTQKMCITSGIIGGRCEENFGDEKVVKAKVNSEAQIEKTIAEEIISCWDMMGQGKFSLFSPGWTARYGLWSSRGDETSAGSVYSSCVICSRIAFDVETLEKKKIDLTKVDVYDYMLKHKAPGKEISYAEYIASASPAGVSIDSEEKMREIVDAVKENISSEGIEIVEIGDQELNKPTQSGELAIVFMQVKTPSYWSIIKNTATAGVVGGVSVAAVNFAVPGASWLLKGAADLVVAGATVIGATATAIVASVAVVGGVAFQGVNVYRNYETALGYCGDIEFEEGDDYGCSAVRAIYYDADNLKRICTVIESRS